MKHTEALISRLAAACCLLMMLFGGIAHAQGGFTVKGKVIDGDSQPVIGAAVTIQGTTTGVGTDFDGNFSLTVPNEDTVLEIAFLGYSTQQVKVGKQDRKSVV